MHSEKSKPEDERIVPETRFTEFLALSVDPRVGISRSAYETDDYLLFENRSFYNNISNCSSLLMSRVSYCSPWAIQNFLGPLKTVQTLSFGMKKVCAIVLLKRLLGSNISSGLYDITFCTKKCE